MKKFNWPECKTSLTKSYGKTFSIIFLVTSFFISGAAFTYVVRAYHRLSKPELVETAAQPSAAESTAPSGNQASSARLSVLHITVRPWGFEPSEITLPKGEFALRVDNRSGLDDLNIRLLRETGQVQSDRELYNRKPERVSYYKLIPGRYLLSNAGHADWSCQITITAQ
jgi:hypothetical protein